VRIKGQSNKRPRPKPTTASIKNIEVTSTSPPNVESVITNITNAIDETNVVVTESLADQQANLLQFLVSNPPAWVLDEIINGSTLTTWYPLPIAGKFSVQPGKHNRNVRKHKPS
jgi:L-lactate utilization protein LutC